MNKVMFMGEDCTVQWQYYPNSRIAIKLFCNQGSMGIATVNMPKYPLGDSQVIIKDWSENKGVLGALVGAGIVRDTGEVAPSGYVEGNVCDLLVVPE